MTNVTDPTGAGASPRVSRRRALGAALGAAALAAPAVARAEPAVRWRMATSWPKNLPGPGVAAQRIVDRVAEMTGGRFAIQLFGAGEVVPAFEVLDAVGGGAVECGHSASFFWQGKMAAAVFFTTVPFGLLPAEHQAWIEQGGGRALWGQLYAPFGVKPFLAGNTGPSLAGWFRREIRTLDDVRGLRIRAQGIGGEVWRRLGATPVSIPPGEIPTALSTGAIDAVEFLSASNDMALGLHKAAPFYARGGFNKPNGAAELLVARSAWDALPQDLRAILQAACDAAHSSGLADAEHANAIALTRLAEEQKTQAIVLPDELIGRARAATRDIIAEIARSGALADRIRASYEDARDRSTASRRMSQDLLRTFQRG